jgi:hypothetical protein
MLKYSHAHQKKLFYPKNSVGYLDPVEVATGIFLWAATKQRSRRTKKFRLRPMMGHDLDKNLGRDPGMRS